MHTSPIFEQFAKAAFIDIIPLGIKHTKLYAFDLKYFIKSLLF